MLASIRFPHAYATRVRQITPLPMTVIGMGYANVTGSHELVVYFWLSSAIRLKSTKGCCDMDNEDRKTRKTYMGTRYGRSQMFINWREQRIVAGLLEMTERPLSRILDIPSGHGRLTPQLRAAAGEELVCGDISLKRLKALVDAEPEQVGLRHRVVPELVPTVGAVVVERRGQQGLEAV